MTTTVASPIATVADLMSEDELLSRFIGTARRPGLLDLLGLPVLHIRDARGQHVADWPDLIICDDRHAALYGFELKKASGRPSKGQRELLARLAQCSRFESGLVRPADWPRIERLLLEGPR